MQAPHKHKRHLVLGGGGVRAAAEISAAEALRRAGVFNSGEGRYDLQDIIGTSGGAVAGVPIALGATGAELLDLARSIPYASFDDTDFGWFRDAARFWRHFGARKGEELVEWLRELIKRFAGDPDITFARVAMDPRFAKLHIVTTDIDHGRTAVCSKANTPHAMIWQAVRLSLSIPFYFQAIRPFGWLGVDGGLLLNYHIRYFDGPAWPGGVNPHVVGIRVGDRQDVDRGIAPLFRTPCKGIRDFAQRNFALLYNAVQNRHLEPADWDRTVWVDGVGVEATKFDLTAADIVALLRSGEAGALKWLKWMTAQRAGMIT